ncbi:hypothetical protein Tco_0844216 [Tanacetum coccineum]
MEIIPDKEEVAIDAIPLAVKSTRILDWKIHKEGKKSYYQIMRADGKSKMYMIFSQMLKIFDREDLEDLYKLSMRIYILVEKKYPLTPPTLSMMLKRSFKLILKGRIVGIKSLVDAVWITTAHVCVNAAQLELVLLRDFKENMPNTITPTDRVGDSLVITPFHDDPYMTSPLSPDYTLASPDYTIDTPHSDEESEPIDASVTRTISPSDSTSPLSPNHLLTWTSPNPTPSRAFYYRSTARVVVRTHPTLSPGISAIVTEAECASLGSEESEDKGPGSEGEEVASEEQQQQALAEDPVPNSPVTTPEATITVDADEFIEAGAQLDLYRSILYDHTQRLDALPNTLLEEAWAGQTDAQRAALWQTRYEDQKDIQALRMQHAMDQHEI